jgi:type I restriction enzyme R subunit
MTDFVIMPNHSHMLVIFPNDDAMLSQCAAWKRFTGRRINKRMSDSGRFWQQDGFDHLVRSEEQFESFRRYIASNPKKAGLAANEYFLYSNPDAGRK